MSAQLRQFIQRVKRRKWAPPIILLLLLLPAVQPLLSGNLPWRADGLLHFHRLAQLERALSFGELYPRWTADLAYGYGFPLFNYYAPLSYYLALPWRWLGLSVAASMQMGYAAAFLALGLGLYLWARGRWGNTAGWGAAVAAVYAPYILYNGLHRGALPELWGLAWLALTFAALDHFSQKPDRWRGAAVLLAYAALLLTHNILALISAPFLLLYAVLVHWFDNPTQPTAASWTSAGGLLKGAISLLLLGVGLTAFFWLPAIAEKDLVQIDQLILPADLQYGNNFFDWGDLLAAPQTADADQVNPFLPFGLGWPQFLLALLAWLPPARRKDAPPPNGVGLRNGIGLLLLIAIFMSLPLSRPLWDHLPLLPFVQFPWRFMGPGSLFLALLAGLGLARLAERDRRLPLAGFAALLIYALFWLFPSAPLPQTDPSPLETIQFERRTGALGTTSAGDYLPAAVVELPPPDSLRPLYEAAAGQPIPRLARDHLPPSVAISAEEYGYTKISLHYRADEPFTAQFYLFDFSGWQARLDGRPIPSYASEPQGLLTVDLPPGKGHLTVAFESTPLRRLANGIALGSLLLFGLWFWRVNWPHSPPRRVNAAPQIPILPLLILFALIFTLKLAYLDRGDTIFRQSIFDGERMTRTQFSLAVNFGQEMLLIGYDLPRATLPADEPLAVDLYWRILPPVDVEYSVAVNLVDELGRRFGQHDSFHPAGYPTTRWQPREYGRDRHHLEIWPGTPPGQYQLMVTVYSWADGRQLEYLNEHGQPLGIDYPLTDITITPPNQPFQLADLPLTDLTARPLAGGLQLVGETGLPAAGVVGQWLPFTLYWRAEAAPTADYQARLTLRDAAGNGAAHMVWSPGRDAFPSSAWTPGTIVRDERLFLLPAARNGDPAQPLLDGRYALQLDLLDEMGQPVGETLTLAEIEATAPKRTFDPPPAALAAEANFSGTAALAAYQLDGRVWQPGNTLPLTLFWRSLALTERSLVVFVHLVGPDGRIEAQLDRPPQAGLRPTSGWLPGEIVRDEYHLWLSPALPPGAYELRVGLYDPADGRRLPLLNEPADYWRLPITIE